MTDSASAPVVELVDAGNYLGAPRRSSQTVVLTNGCFDLIHHGHMQFLQACASLGDVLVVGLNDDESVTTLKGRGRPVLAADQRAQVLAAIRWVDLVVIFQQLTAGRLIEVVRPDVYVKGAEYDPASGDRPLPELESVTKAGCKLHFVNLTPGASSSDMYRRASAAVPRDPTDQG
ncbi:MAG: adenylyltransferase/cytidyltransferase family protein [Chloroflexi bacterium]|nr:adenylyltransferase/cytidyltransferase family protein [Chloroflexota bacterium]